MSLIWRRFFNVLGAKKLLSWHFFLSFSAFIFFVFLYFFSLPSFCFFSPVFLSVFGLSLPFFPFLSFCLSCLCFISLIFVFNLFSYFFCFLSLIALVFLSVFPTVSVSCSALFSSCSFFLHLSIFLLVVPISYFLTFHCFSFFPCLPFFSYFLIFLCLSFCLRLSFFLSFFGFPSFSDSSFL